MRLYHWVSFSLLLSCTPAMAADGDYDGVPDAQDRCPHTAQINKVNAGFPYAPAVSQTRLSPKPQAQAVDAHGCELDSDGDGVKDSADYCPNDPKEALIAGIAPNGCPKHSDGDGTPDYRDKCPGTPKGARADASGCPVG